MMILPRQARDKHRENSKKRAFPHQYGIKVFWLDASEPEISTSDAGRAALDFNNSIGTVRNPLTRILLR